MRRLLSGVGALIALAALLIGIPWLLVVLAGNPFPTGSQWEAMFSLTPDYGNVILLTKILPLLVWAFWAAFAIPFVVELFAAMGGRVTRKRMPAFRLQQKLSATLIGAIAVMFAGSAGALAAPLPASAEVASVQSIEHSFGNLSLEVPEDAVKQQLVHSVEEGDTLWDLAATYLGDGERYPEIFDANRGVQHDGRVLTDPDLILPGWEMKIPSVHVDAPASPALSAPAAVFEAPAPGFEAPSESLAETAAAAPQDVAVVQDAEADLAAPLMTVGGISSLLASGLLTALGMRRLGQRRRRAKGERIALPTAEVADLEFDLRMVESPRSVSDVDQVLRTLQVWAEDTGGALPSLLAVRITDDEISLFLTEPGQLPEPFEPMHPDRTSWRAHRAQITPAPRPAVSPYPALVTLGVDSQGGSLLLDLEHIGALSVTGDETTARGMLDALACEFATNPWSDQIQVTLVGMNRTLAHDLDRFRIHEVADAEALVRNLRADLAQRRSALDTWRVDDVLEARTRASELEAWAPHIVIMGIAPTDAVRDELAALVARMPRLGIATIAQGPALADGALIEIDSPELAWYRSGGALPPLPFRPQILAGGDLARARELFDVTEQGARAADLEQEQRLANFDAVPEDTVPRIQVPDWPAPYVRLLGPVDALHVADKNALPSRGIELLAFLLLQESSSASGALVQSRLWSTQSGDGDEARRLAQRLRAALGHDPEGHALLPEGESGAGLTTHERMRTDWHDFCALIGPNLSTTSNENLIQAIRLVRGAPFERIPGTRRGWWSWRGPIEETMRAAILDAADELTHRALKKGRFGEALLGAKVAQAIDPRNEAGWRLEFETAISAGDAAGFIEAFETMLKMVGDEPLDDETQQLIEDAHDTIPGLARL